MALDADPQYYALDPDDTGAQPLDTGNEGDEPGLSPAIAALAQQLNVPYAQAAQLAATGAPGAPAQAATDPNAAALNGTSPAAMDALRAMTLPQAAPPAGGPGAGPLGVNPALDPNAAAQAGMQAQGPLGLNPPAASPPGAPMVPPAQGTPNAALMPNQAQAPMPAPTYADTTAAPSLNTSLSALPPALQAIMQQKAAQQTNQPPAPGALPHHDNRVIQALGVLSALMGGPGAKIAGQYIQAQKQNDLDTQARTQQQTQQQFQNQTAQSEAGTAFVQNLAKLDAGTQEQVVRNMTPPQMLAAGFTPSQVKAEFFDASGKFLPITEADKPETAGQQAQMLRAQAYSRDRLSGLTPAGQQALHDGFKATPDEWQKEYGLPYEGFAPLQTVRSAQGDTRLGQGQQRLDQGDAALNLKTTAQQDIRYKLFLGLSPDAKQQELQSYASHPQDLMSKYGRAADQMNTGQLDANRIAEEGVNNRETDARRTDATRIKLTDLNIAARAAIDRANNEVATRGQDLRAQLGQDQIRQRAGQFAQRYGAGSAGAAEKMYQSLLKERMGVMKEMTRLSEQRRDPDTGALMLSQRDQGRFDDNGNAIANPPPTAAYTEYMQLQQYDQQLQAQQYAVKFPQGGPATSAAPYSPAQPGAAPAATAAPAMAPPPGRGLMPAAVAVPPALQRLLDARHPAALGPLPGFGPNTPGAAYTSHGSVVAMPPQLVQMARQSAARQQASRQGGTTPPGAAAPRSGLIIQGTINGQGVLFHAPTSKAEFDAMTPLKRHAYVQYMKQQGRVR